MKTSQLAVVCATITVLTIAVVLLVIGLTIISDTNDKQVDHVIITTLAVISPSILALLAYLKASKINDNMQNGNLKETIKQAIAEDKDNG